MHRTKGISTEEMSALRSPYLCIKCGEGVMIPAIEEGEADDTENLLCVQCHFHDSIPTAAIISGQILTSAMGLAICLYLFLNHVLSSLDSSATLGLAMGMIVVGFAIGFIYVLGKALNGIKHRSAYMPNQRADR